MTWEELERGVARCERCPLCQGRTNVVFGEGNRQAELMLVGEGPGREEDLQGRPFVGRSGQLLDQILELVGLSRESVFIANVVKCRPPMNRDPLPEERKACSTWLQEQIRLVRPKLILCLGRISAKELIDPQFMVSRQHGEIFEKDGVRYMGTFHPAALLRDPGRRPEAFGDFKAARRLLDDE